MCMLIVVLAIHLLQMFEAVLQELFIAALLVYLIMPVHAWLVRHRVPPMLSFAIIVLLFLGCSFGLGQMIYYSIADFNSNWQVYQKNLKNLGRLATERLPAPAAEQLNLFVHREEHSLEGQIHMLQSALGSFFGFLSQMVVVVIYLVFLLAERSSLTRRLHNSFEGQRGRDIVATVDRIHASIAQYLAVKTAMSVLTGASTALVLLVFGVDYAVFWGILAFLFNYIPYLGSYVTVILPVLLSLVQFEDPGWALAILAVLLIIQNLIAYAIEPRLAGSRLNLSPLVIILSLAFWATIWGIVGMILAVPLVVVVKSILENFRETKPLATLLSNE